MKNQSGARSCTTTTTATNDNNNNCNNNNHFGILENLFQTSLYRTGIFSTECYIYFLSNLNRLVGLVVRRPPRERKVPGSNPACVWIFSGSSHTRDLKLGTPVATLPGAWHYRVSTGTGRPGVSIL